jgi:hypothetical protein
LGATLLLLPPPLFDCWIRVECSTATAAPALSVSGDEPILLSLPFSVSVSFLYLHMRSFVFFFLSDFLISAGICKFQGRWLPIQLESDIF